MAVKCLILRSWDIYVPDKRFIMHSRTYQTLSIWIILVIFVFVRFTTLNSTEPIPEKAIFCLEAGYVYFLIATKFYLWNTNPSSE